MRCATTVCLIVAALAHLIMAAPCSAQTRISLRDHWSIQSSAQVSAQGPSISVPGYSTDGWYPTTVPMTVLAALVENKVYPDPFYGDNIKKIPGYRDPLWLVMKEDSPFFPAWWYRTEFDVPADLKSRNVTLHFDGINYRANVWLNGQRIADSDTVVGMFRRFEFDVNGALRCGERNCLALEITAPGHVPEKNYHTKQIEATTGWDDHNPQPPDLNMGVWQDVYLTSAGPVALRHPYVASRLDVPSLETARLTVSVQAVNKTAERVSAVIAGEIPLVRNDSAPTKDSATTQPVRNHSAPTERVQFEHTVDLAPREAKWVVFTPEAFPQLVVKNPRVWWPNDVGAQELYTLGLKASAAGTESDASNTTFGIREATTYINDEGWRGYRVNGRNILIRGGAWMTSDMLLRLTHKRYDALIRYAKEAHFNMLRSEGFSIRETEDFYDLCDRYGIMVTQQLFGRSIPDEPLAIACVEDTLLRIRNHPSLVHFLGHDETFPTPTLDQAYRDLIAKYTPERTYQPHSGAFDVEDRFKTGGTRTGSLQVWTYATPSHYYTSKNTGAWGFAQSGGIGGVFGPLESLRRTVPESALWPPFTDAWSLHTVTQGGNYFSPIVKALNDRYGKPENVDDFFRKAFALNYECARGMFEAYGRNKYSATGITTWKYDAAWPASPTWQYIDWYLMPTGAYYGAKKACEPLHIQYSYDDDSVYVVNSRYQDYAGLRATARILNFDLTEKWSKTVPVDVAADGKTKVFIVERPGDLTKCFYLRLALEDSSGKLVSENLYWLSTVPDQPSPFEGVFDMAPPKSTSDYTDLNTLPPVSLRETHEFEEQGPERVARVTVTNPSDHLAFAVRIAALQGADGPEIAPAYWEDNYFSLFPGEQKTVAGRFAAADAGAVAPAIRLSGWNVAP